MSLPGISFTLTENNLGRLPENADGVTGFLYPGSAPAEFGSDLAKQIFSVQEAEDLGITEGAYPIYHYHISEFYRLNPNEEFWASFYPTDGSSALLFEEIITLQNFTGGRLKLIGVWTSENLSSSMVQTLHGKALELFNLQVPAHIVLTANIVDVTVPDLAAGAFYNVSVVTDQSGDGVGADLFAEEETTIGAIGALLGSISRLPVSTAVTYVQQFADLGGAELDVIATGDGTLYKTLSKGQITAVSNKRYIQLIKHDGISGTYWGRDYTAAGQGDFDNIRNNRIKNKALRVVKAALLPKVGSPVLTNPVNGNIAEVAAASLERIAQAPLDAMIAASEISGAEVFIDRNQKPSSNDEVKVQIDVVPVGAAMTISVTLGLATTV
jgi:hypothetical protein